VPVDTVLPTLVSEKLFEHRKSNILLRAYVKAETVMGSRFDYLSVNPKESLRYILEYKGKREKIGHIYNRVSEADRIVINGEGDMIFCNPPRRSALFYLAMVELAKHLDKKTYYVNGMISDPSVGKRNNEFASHCADTLAQCDRVVLRDTRSVNILQELRTDVKATYLPDCLFSWFDRLSDSQSCLPADSDCILPFSQEDDVFWGAYNFQKPYICVGGGGRAAEVGRRSIVNAYCQLVEDVKELGLDVYLPVVTQGDNFLYEVAERTGVAAIPSKVGVLMGGAILANARLLITGRFHSVVLSSLGGVPCIYLGSDSHKTKTIQNTLEYEQQRVFSAAPNKEERVEMTERARDYLNQGDALRQRIRSITHRLSAESKKLANIVAEKNGSGHARQSKI